MRILTLFLIGAFLFSMESVSAQELTKEEKKFWKKEAKKYKKDLASLKRLKEERDKYKEEAQQVADRINDLESAKMRAESQLANKDDEIGQLNGQLMSAQATIRQLNEEKEVLTPRNEGESMIGTVFRVQIGAYEKNDISEDLNTSDNLALEVSDGLQKVMIGQFSDYALAKELQDQLKKMGVKGAWVVPYRDGVRVPLAEVVDLENY